MAKAAAAAVWLGNIAGGAGFEGTGVAWRAGDEGIPAADDNAKGSGVGRGVGNTLGGKGGRGRTCVFGDGENVVGLLGTNPVCGAATYRKAC